LLVIPAQAGIQLRCITIVAITLIHSLVAMVARPASEACRDNQTHRNWIPACAGMTSFKARCAGMSGQ
jgi:hypothetical protein